MYQLRMRKESQSKALTILRELSLGGFLPWRGRIEGKDGDGMGVRGMRCLTERYERESDPVIFSGLGGLERLERSIFVRGLSSCCGCDSLIQMDSRP